MCLLYHDDQSSNSPGTVEVVLTCMRNDVADMRFKERGTHKTIYRSSGERICLAIKDSRM